MSSLTARAHSAPVFCLCNKETADVKTKTEQIICQFSNEKEQKPSYPEPKIVLIPKGNRLLTFDKERLKMTNESLDIVGSIKGLSDWVQTQQMLYKQLIARKVKIRAIVQETNNPEANQTNLQKHKLLNHLNIGFSPSPLCTYLGIYDNKDVKRAKSHFEKLWNESTITKNQQLMQ